jgi:GT2 family glycosyltransferase
MKPVSKATLWKLLNARDASMRAIEAHVHEQNEEIDRLVLVASQRKDEIRQVTLESEKRQAELERVTEEAEKRQTERQTELQLVTREAKAAIEKIAHESQERQLLIERLHNEMAERELAMTSGPAAKDNPSKPGETDVLPTDKVLAEVLEVYDELQDALSRMGRVIGQDAHAHGGGPSFHHKSLEEMAEALRQKERRIATLSRAVEALKQAHTILSPSSTVKRLMWRLRAVLSPRLGNLRQHPPVPMRPIKAYRSKVSAEKLPMISLVTPSYRQGDFIERTIRSVLNQDYGNLEYIVQDGGSSDQTVSVIERYTDRITRWESRPDNGQAHAINLGLAESHGDIMGWLNSDDVLLPNALTFVGDYFARHPSVDVIYGNRLLIDEHDSEIGRWVLPKHSRDAISWADFVPQETMFWRRDIWDRAGGQIDESFQFAIDWDLLIRFREAGARFVHIPRFLGGFRVHEEQKTAAAIDDTGFEEMERIRARVHGEPPTPEQIKIALRPYLARHMVAHLTHSVGYRLRALFTKGRR